MRELIGLDYNEIADALNLTAGAARQAVYEARVSLAQSDQGRDMACEAARRSISAGDGRAMRGRRLRAHMRGCGSCTSFSEQLGVRRATLPGLLPPLPVAASVAILGGLVGGAATLGAGASVGALGSAGSSGVLSVIAGGASQVAGASAAAKGAAAAVAVAVVAGVGTVEVKKAVDSPAPPPRAAQQEQGGGSGAKATQIALNSARPSLASSRRARTNSKPAADAPPQPAAGGSPSTKRRAAPNRPGRAPRTPRLDLDRGIRPKSAPIPVSEAPTPVPVQAPAPAAPVTAPPSYPAGSWQQQYTDSMRQAQLGLQVGGQVYQQAMRLTQQIVGGIFRQR
jgi:hypothetical protein